MDRQDYWVLLRSMDNVAQIRCRMGSQHRYF